jgi:hypothetical protein
MVKDEEVCQQYKHFIYTNIISSIAVLGKICENKKIKLNETTAVNKLIKFIKILKILK